MAVAATVKEFLEQRGVPYDIVHHTHTPTSMRTAEAAHIPGDRLAKAVLLQDDRGVLLAVLPASRHLDLDALNRLLGRQLSLTTEAEIGARFRDCEVGAVPAVGPAYGLDTVLDQSLADHPDIYFEAGDHESLVHLRGADFLNVLGSATRGHFSAHV
jgi:Ala-tRNA(Pro) deacylase